MFNQTSRELEWWYIVISHISSTVEITDGLRHVEITHLSPNNKFEPEMLQRNVFNPVENYPY